uniref:Uncharacterized protein n=1 Tax=Bombyx mori TaxID=7091 RepID=A0A8R2QW05_BOMMO|nr:uncharacterized protein LOC101742357 isoform X3 [Bombyx mori]XP_037870435.1 uncharacterized protein LOC101742357 isoform X3 [Bombyx mori]
MVARVVVTSVHKHRQNGDNGDNVDPGTTDFRITTGGADSASGGSGGSGMECLPLRSQSFHYLVSEQAKSLVALQELQNEVGALLEFRDLVIETFPNLRSKMAPSRGNSVTRRDWEPGVRVRRKLPAPQEPRAKPHPSVQDSGFSTETSCKEAHSSASASASASRSRPLEDELWALLDVIQRKGGRLREEAELLRGELDERATAEDEFTHTVSHQHCDCEHVQRLREERDALLERTAQLEAQVHSSSKPTSALGRLDSTFGSPSRVRVPTPDSEKFAAILLESNPVELQRQLLNSTVQNQVLSERLKRVVAQRSSLFERLERARDVNEDLKFRLEEKSIEAETARGRVRQLEAGAHSSMREMEPLALPGEAPGRRARPSRIPLHKGAAPRQPPPRPPSAHSQRSTKSAVPVRREPAPDAKIRCFGSREPQRARVRLCCSAVVAMWPASTKQ